MRARDAALAIALLLAAAAPGGARAAGLVDDFRAALDYEPTWQAAVATRDAGVEARAQGLAGLLPQVSVSATQGKASTESTFLAPDTPIDRQNNKYDTYNYALQMRQPLFRLRNWATYEQGKAQEAYAEANLVAARQDLALRVVTAYAEWAAARAELEAADVQVASADFVLRAAQRSQQAGDATRVDVETARSRLAQAEARRTDAQGQLEAAMLGWRQLTGRDGPRAKLPVVGADTSARLRLEAEKLDDWRARAISSSSQIRALERSVDAARQEAKKVRADHYPTLDLYASRTLSQSDTDVTINRRYDTTRFGVQLNLPLYQGGAVDSSVRQALANLRRAESELEAGKLRLKLQIERDWQALLAARASADAARTQVETSQLAAYAARQGTKAGSATRVDEANALAQEADGRRDLALAGARALVMWARLMGAADRLDEETLAAVEAALTPTALASGAARDRP
jgi:protease secretion system outer membrane protein